MQRGHQPIPLEGFKGLWDQGDIEEVPPNHFTFANNVRYVGSGSIATRWGVAPHQNVVAPLGNVVRIYNYVTQDANTYLALTYISGIGRLYHVVDSTTVFGPILTITGMQDFAFYPYAGRAYISPFATFSPGGVDVEKGLENEFLYVYKGDGTAARKAGGVAPTGTITVGNGAAGNIDVGEHLFGVVFETDTGYLSAPGAFNNFTTVANTTVSFSTIPVSPDSFVVRRHIVATRVIEDYNGNTTGYTYYFIPGATINDNVTTTLPNIGFFDADLLDDASKLIDNFAEIAAGAVLNLYHNRLCIWTFFDNISIGYASLPGEPEAFDQISGLIEFPPDGNPITNAKELRDVLYVFKRTKTVSFVDNEDDPSSWPLSNVDAGLGTTVHGIATVIDSGAANTDYLIVGTRRGITIFNGRYQIPELSWKIYDYWARQTASNARYIQILNDTISQILYITLPDRTMLVAWYNDGLDPQNMVWIPWSFAFKVNTVALVNDNELLIAAESGLNL